MGSSRVSSQLVEEDTVVWTSALTERGLLSNKTGLGSESRGLSEEAGDGGGDD